MMAWNESGTNRVSLPSVNHPDPTHCEQEDRPTATSLANRDGIEEGHPCHGSCVLVALAGVTPVFIFLTFSSHVSVCWCAVLGTPLLASPLPNGDLQCGESARTFFFFKRWTLLTLHRTLEFVDPRERAQSPVPLCACPGFQAHGHACARAVPGCVRAWTDGSLQTFTASCAEANCASMRACVRWRTQPVVRRQRRDQHPFLKTGQVVEATVPSFPQRSCQSLARAHGTDASVFRACARENAHRQIFDLFFRPGQCRQDWLPGFGTVPSSWSVQWVSLPNATCVVSGRTFQMSHG